MNELNEIFELLPNELTNIGSYHGEPFYSNKKIVEATMGWIESSPITKPISNKILEGIEKRSILIGYANKSKLSFIFKRIGAIIGPKTISILGQYSAVENKLVILLDKNVDVFGRALSEIPPTLAHELIHMAANYNIRSYLSMTMRSFLLPFYKRFFNSVAPNTVNVPDNILVRAISDLANYSENLSSPPDIQYVFNIWSSYLEKVYDQDKVKNILNNLYALFMFIHGYNLSIEQKRVLKIVFDKYCDAYTVLGIKNVGDWTTPGQELIFTSEVVCIASQWKLSNNVIKLINYIRF